MSRISFALVLCCIFEDMQSDTANDRTRILLELLDKIAVSRKQMPGVAAGTQSPQRLSSNGFIRRFQVMKNLVNIYVWIRFFRSSHRDSSQR